MNSLGSSSKWPSYDSLPSTSSYIHSESEHTEDEADVFSEGEADSGMTKTLSAGEGLALPGNYLAFSAHSGQSPLRSKSDQPKHRPDRALHPSLAPPPGDAALGSSAATPGDLIFAQKCTSLRRFIRPLIHLLHGLKTGRFSKSLSSFQQSVAMDRLQRILGILQRPEMGEKYLQNLLQIEVMLKIWFPQVAFQSADAPSQTAIPRLRSQWHQNQLHMPVKKRKLSWSDHEHTGKVPTKQKQHRNYGSCQATTSPDVVSTRLLGSPYHRPDAGSRLEAAWGSSTDGHEFTDSTGTLSRSPYFCSKRDTDNEKRPEVSLITPCGSPAAQDSSVSSSDSVTTKYSP